MDLPESHRGPGIGIQKLDILWECYCHKTIYVAILGGCAYMMFGAIVACTSDDLFSVMESRRF